MLAVTFRRKKVISGPAASASNVLIRAVDWCLVPRVHACQSRQIHFFWREIQEKRSVFGLCRNTQKNIWLCCPCISPKNTKKTQKTVRIPPQRKYIKNVFTCTGFGSCVFGLWEDWEDLLGEHTTPLDLCARGGVMCLCVRSIHS